MKIKKSLFILSIGWFTSLLIYQPSHSESLPDLSPLYHNLDFSVDIDVLNLDLPIDNLNLASDSPTLFPFSNLSNNNEALILQRGWENSALIAQEGNRNFALIYQEGLKNSAIQTQSGNENKALAIQIGERNTAIQTQESDGNLAIIYQIGVGNFAEQYQGGLGGFRSIVIQKGNYNWARVYQY